MRKFLLLAALTLTACAIVPVAALAATPIDTVKADLAKLTADVQTKHDAVVADAQKLQVRCDVTRRHHRQEGCSRDDQG